MMDISFTLPIKAEWRNNQMVGWCNGSTIVFGSICIGSTPIPTTKIKTLKNATNDTRIKN